MLVATWGWLRGPQAGHPLILKLLPVLAATNVAFLLYTHLPSQSRLTLPLLLTCVLGVAWVSINGLMHVSRGWEADRVAGIKRNYFQSDDGL